MGSTGKHWHYISGKHCQAMGSTGKHWHYISGKHWHYTGIEHIISYNIVSCHKTRLELGHCQILTIIGKQREALVGICEQWCIYIKGVTMANTGEHFPTFTYVPVFGCRRFLHNRCQCLRLCRICRLVCHHCFCRRICICICICICIV